MVERYVALIRGINVGRAKRIAMADLRALFEDFGYTDVHTLLNSGNVVFGAGDLSLPDPASRIEVGLATRLGVSARVMVVGAADLAGAIESNPFSDAAYDPSRLLVTFLANSADLPLLEPLLGKDWAPEALALGAGVAFLWCPGGVTGSRLVSAVSRVFGEAMTMRNWATVLKLGALADSTE